MEPDISISIVLYAQTDKKKYMYIIMPHINTEVGINGPILNGISFGFREVEFF